MTGRFFAMLLSGFMSGACEDVGDARAQWVVHVSSDAPLPTLGDRVLVEVLDASGVPCGDCKRTFEVTAPNPFPLSFGVSDSGNRTRVRIRLYRSRSVGPGGEPASPNIDLLAELPAIGDGVVQVNAVLRGACFGKPSDIAAGLTCDPESGALSSEPVLAVAGEGVLPLPGQFGGGEPSCVGTPPPGMICIPGGTFLLGSIEHGFSGEEYDPVPEQLVRVHPFFIDMDEFTLDALAQLGPDAPKPRPQSVSSPFCTYLPGRTGKLPVNCVDKATANELCKLAGKRLLTEAEWEFAAGNRTLDTKYPWILPDDSKLAICERAAVARGDVTVSRECLLLVPTLEPGPTDRPLFDVSALGVMRMAGNVAEWVADDFARYSDARCWGSDFGLRESPRCVADEALGAPRGGSFGDFPYGARVFGRRAIPANSANALLGLRCAKDDGDQG